MQSIFTRLEQTNVETRQADLEKYYNLLATVDPLNATDSQVKSLNSVVTRLGSTPAQCQTDHQAIEELRRLFAEANATAGHATAIEKAIEAKDTAMAKRQSLMLEQNEICKLAMEREAEARHMAGTYGNAVRSLREIRRQDHLIFKAAIGTEADELLAD